MLKCMYVQKRTLKTCRVAIEQQMHDEQQQQQDSDKHLGTKRTENTRAQLVETWMQLVTAA